MGKKPDHCAVTIPYTINCLILSNSGFLNLGTIEIRGKMILCFEGSSSVHCRMSRSTSGICQYMLVTPTVTAKSISRLGSKVNPSWWTMDLIWVYISVFILFQCVFCRLVYLNEDAANSDHYAYHYILCKRRRMGNRPRRKEQERATLEMLKFWR